MVFARSLKSDRAEEERVTAPVLVTRSRPSSGDCGKSWRVNRSGLPNRMALPLTTPASMSPDVGASINPQCQNPSHRP